MFGYLRNELSVEIDIEDDIRRHEPEERVAKMAMMGIAPDYFLEIAPDPTDAEQESIRGGLMELTGRAAVGSTSGHG